LQAFPHWQPFVFASALALWHPHWQAAPAQDLHEQFLELDIVFSPF
jgi:hypothetical protein